MTRIDSESVWIAVRNHPLLDREVALETVLSYPVPVARGSTVIFRFFLYSVQEIGQGGGEVIHVPFARVSATKEGRVIEYVDRAWGDPFPGLPSTGVLGEGQALDRGRTPQQALARHQEFFRRCDRLLEIFPRDPVSEEECAAVESFLAAFFELTSAQLVPYYESLNSSFFAWLHGNGRGANPPARRTKGEEG